MLEIPIVHFIIAIGFAVLYGAVLTWIALNKIRDSK